MKIDKTFVHCLETFWTLWIPFKTSAVLIYYGNIKQNNRTGLRFLQTVKWKPLFRFEFILIISLLFQEQFM